MRYNFCLPVLFAVTLSVQLSAQDFRIIVNDKGKIGFADGSGKEVIQCQYDRALPFHDGSAIVTRKGKSGLIDQQGNMLLPLSYEEISRWNENLYVIKEGKRKMGLADHRGNIVLPAKYSYIFKPNCYGKALIALGGKAAPDGKKTYIFAAKYGIVDAKGNILVEPKYRGLYEFTLDGTGVFPYNEGKHLGFSYHYTTDTLVTDCSFLGFSKNSLSVYKAGIMDGTGKEILPRGLFWTVMMPQNGMVRYYNAKGKQTLCGYYNLETGASFQVASYKATFDGIEKWSHGDFTGDIAPVNATTWSFIDKTGQTLKSGYTDIRRGQSAGLWAAKNNNGLWEVFDEKNRDVTPLSGFGDIMFPSGHGEREIFSVMRDGMYGCVTRDGEIAIPFEYDKMLSNTYDVVPVRKNGNWGVLNADGSPLIPIEYSDIVLPSEKHATHYWVKKPDSLFYYYNVERSELSPIGYKAVRNFSKGYAYVVPVGMNVANTSVNRAQVYAPGTDSAKIDKADIDEHKDAFVNIIDTNGNMVFDLPVSTLYVDKVRKEIETHNVSGLTLAQKRNILLDITKENRSYDMKSKLGEEEWNY